MLRSMLMTASDIAASTKPWSIQQRVARLVTDEFLVQGDKERNELKIQPQALMDRERQHELPQLQIRWISDICLPLYSVSVQKVQDRIQYVQIRIHPFLVLYYEFYLYIDYIFL